MLKICWAALVAAFVLGSSGFVQAQPPLLPPPLFAGQAGPVDDPDPGPKPAMATPKETKDAENAGAGGGAPRLRTDPVSGNGFNGYQLRTDPLPAIGGTIVLTGDQSSSGSLATQGAGGRGGGNQPFDSTAGLRNNFSRQTNKGFRTEAAGDVKDGEKVTVDDLVQIKVRIVEVRRTGAFSASSVLDYVSNAGSAGTSKVTNNNLNADTRDRGTGATRFANPSLLGVASNALSTTGSGLLVNLTAEHINLIASFLAEDFNGDLITAPEVTTLNTQNVEFVAGQTLPFELGQSIVGTNNSATQNFFYKQVGTYISVTPTILENDEIDLAIVVRLSEAGTANVSKPDGAGGFDLAGVSTEANVRAISNIVRVRSGFGLVMGGLIGEREEEAVSKVPVLGDIPWAGALFRSKSTGRSKTETLIFVEARVLSDEPSYAWYETIEDFRLAHDYVNGPLLDNPLECGLYRAGLGAYLPPLLPGEECFWEIYEERMMRKNRRISTALDDATK